MGSAMGFTVMVPILCRGGRSTPPQLAARASLCMADALGASQSSTGSPCKIGGHA